MESNLTICNIHILYQNDASDSEATSKKNYVLIPPPHSTVETLFMIISVLFQKKVLKQSHFFDQQFCELGLANITSPDSAGKRIGSVLILVTRRRGQYGSIAHFLKNGKSFSHSRAPRCLSQFDPIQGGRERKGHLSIFTWQPRLDTQVI